MLVALGSPRQSRPATGGVKVAVLIGRRGMVAGRLFPRQDGRVPLIEGDRRESVGTNGNGAEPLPWGTP
jgi:hypothetical protein